MAPIISSATLSVHCDQTSITLLYFSPWVISPSAYWCSKSLTWARAPSIRPRFESGTTMSSLPKEIPARHAWPKPSFMMRSANSTVSFCPQWRYTSSITWLTSLLVSRRLIMAKSTRGWRGRICDSSMRPGVVSTVRPS